jgi:hypothetical protein
MCGFSGKESTVDLPVSFSYINAPAVSATNSSKGKP